jgi:hypothetical protein
MSVFGNTFFEKQGDGSYAEISDRIGAENYWPWGLSVGDLNADGYQDVLVTLGMNYPYRYQSNTVLINDRAERLRPAEFILGVEPRKDRKTAQPWFDLDCAGEHRESHRLCKGADGLVQVWAAVGSRSSVIFDLEGDGDLDVVTSEFNSRPQVLVSDLAERRPPHWLEVDLVGTRSNRDGLGARVTVTAGGLSQLALHDGKSGYLSQSDLPLYFGLGDAESVERVVVEWPSGTRQVIAAPPANQRLVITEPAAEEAPAAES